MGGDQQKLNQTIGTCTGLYLMMGAAAFLVGGGLFAFFELAYDIPAAFRSDARGAFVLVMLYVAAGFIGFLPHSILDAHHDFVIRNLIDTLADCTLTPRAISDFAQAEAYATPRVMEPKRKVLGSKRDARGRRIDMEGETDDGFAQAQIEESTKSAAK